MIFILVCLERYFRRVNALIRVDYFRMQEIERTLGMAKNCIVDILDKWDDRLPNEQTRVRLRELHKKHVGARGQTVMGWTHYALIALWGISIMALFFAP